MIRIGWNLFFIIVCIGIIGQQSSNLVHACRHHVHQYVVTVNAPLSPHAQQEISQHIHKNQYHTAADAMSGVQQQFEYIRSILAHAYADGTVALAITGTDPQVIINSEYLLTTNGSITYANRYTQLSCATVPHLYLPGNSPFSAPELIQKAATTIDPELLKQYDVTLISEQDIRLTPPEKPWMVLYCSLKAFPDKDLLLQSCTLCEQHMMPEDTGSIVADLRFTNQIIITKKG